MWSEFVANSTVIESNGSLSVLRIRESVCERCLSAMTRRRVSALVTASVLSVDGITGSVLLIIFRSLISLCFITCLIRISFNLKTDQKNRPHDPKFPTASSICCVVPSWLALLSAASQLVGNVGFSIILTVFLKV